MPRIVTLDHPSETDLLNLATGREPGEAFEAARRHLDEGCRVCEKRLADLSELIEAIREEEAFNDILTAKELPTLPEEPFGRTLPFTKAKPQLEEIYRISQSAEGPAEEILAAARESEEALSDCLRSLDGHPGRGFALLYSCQKASNYVGENPQRALALARLVFEEAETLMDANVEAKAATPAPRQTVQAEAKILEAQSQMQLGYSQESREAAVAARGLFESAGDTGFGRALADLSEGQAACFANQFGEAERLLKNALGTFAEFGQDHLQARAEGVLGILFLQRGNNTRALAHFESAIAGFNPEKDARPYLAALNNRSMALSRLGRFDEARASYARALNLALKQGSHSLLQQVRNGLAEMDFRRGRFDRALAAFSDLWKEAVRAGFDNEAVFAHLYVAECLGRLGREADMAGSIRTLREAQKPNPFAPSPAMEELFACLDQGSLDADLVRHVREFLQAESSGETRPYQRLRLAS
jgi:tetratricopeptide (TPR) repeat protein